MADYHTQWRQKMISCDLCKGRKGCRLVFLNLGYTMASSKWALEIPKPVSQPRWFWFYWCDVACALRCFWNPSCDSHMQLRLGTSVSHITWASPVLSVETTSDCSNLSSRPQIHILSLGSLLAERPAGETCPVRIPTHNFIGGCQI